MAKSSPENKQIIQAIKNGVQGQGNERLFNFACFIARGFTTHKSKLMAGYSANYDTVALLQTAKAQKYLKSISESREHLQQIPGFTFVDSAGFNKDIRDNNKENTQDRQRSDKALRELLGYDAPIEINKEERTLSITLDGSDITELYKLQRELNPV